MENILSVTDLTTSFKTKGGEVQAVRGISFDVARGEVLGIVGESGSGKSVTSLSILHVLPDNAFHKSGRIDFHGSNLLGMPARAFRKVRGAKISMIFQDPMTSLNPLMTVGKQITEALLEHNPSLGKQAAKDEALRLLKLVRIPDAENRHKAYPHELSGGMRQRAMIAIALSCKPELVIADEPTTALDVTIQDQILDLMRDMQRELNLSIIFITHDLGVVAEICDRVLVMYGGLVMEEGSAEEIFANPRHPYTLGLMASIPKLNQTKGKRLKSIPGSPPDMLDPPDGCPFYPRCEYARNVCVSNMPEHTDLGGGHRSACWMLSPDAPHENNPFAPKGGEDNA